MVTGNQRTPPIKDPISKGWSPSDSRTCQIYTSNTNLSQEDRLRDLLKQDNSTISGDQLPSNRELRAESTSQGPLREINYSHKTITQNCKDPSAPETNNPTQFVTPRGENMTSADNTHKKNVQFRDQNDYPSRHHRQGGHDPILITPRHPFVDSSLENSGKGNPYSNLPPTFGPENPEGRYFSGTVENWHGGDFHEYYFYPSGPTIDPR